ncbi:ankyrin repeat-containing domain protein [Aspergillus heterothallicus]
MSGIEILPDELILQITLFSSESSLAALARTNRRLQQVCTPELYRHNVLHNNSSALEWAAQAGRMDTLQKALHAGAPLPKKQARGKLREEGPPTIRFGIEGLHIFHDFWPHPISLAAQAGHLHIVRYMIDRGVSPNTKNPEWFTLLALAAAHGHVSLAEYLLQVGARQDIRSFVSLRPVGLAAFQGHADIVELLLSALRGGESEDSKKDLMKEALFAAVKAGQVLVVQLLFTHGVQVNLFGSFGTFQGTPLLLAATNGMSELVCLFLAYGADPNLIPVPRASETPLEVAVIQGHEHLLPLLVHGTARLRRTRALAFAVAHGNRGMAETLLRGDTPPQFDPSEIPRPTGWDHEDWVQPLLLAVLDKRLELAELLLDSGADVNVRCTEYPRGGLGKLFNRVLFWAIEDCHEAMVDLLLERGADPEITDMMGCPPLTYAVEGGHEAVVRSLLNHGANPHRAVNQNGKKLLSLGLIKQSIRAQLQAAEGRWECAGGC